MSLSKPQAQGQPLKYWEAVFNATRREASVEEDLRHETLILFFEERDYIEAWVFQKEKGEEAGREHYQITLRLKDKKDKHTILRDMERAGLPTATMSFRPVSNNGKQVSAMDFYCTKIETRIDGPWYDASYQPPKKKVRYEGADLVCMDEPLLWQATVLDWIKAPADDRTIRWIWNEEGNAGKSKLIKYMCWKLGAAKIPLGTATQLKTSVCDKGVHEVFLVDLPRVSGNQESARDLFSALEDIKNGFVETAMYGKPRSLFMNPPHVFIFSNELPDLRLASADRWKVYSLKDQADFLHYMQPSEVRRIIAERLSAKDGSPGASL